MSKSNGDKSNLNQLDGPIDMGQYNNITLNAYFRTLGAGPRMSGDIM